LNRENKDRRRKLVTLCGAVVATTGMDELQNEAITELIEFVVAMSMTPERIREIGELLLANARQANAQATTN
jgi:hypothetical protein